MQKKAFKWALRLALFATLASAVVRIIQSTNRRRGPTGSAVIAGDTWPPVPVKPPPSKGHD
jgi:hypothetical protein